MAPVDGCTKNPGDILGLCSVQRSTPIPHAVHANERGVPIDPAALAVRVRMRLSTQRFQVETASARPPGSNGNKCQLQELARRGRTLEEHE